MITKYYSSVFQLMIDASGIPLNLYLDFFAEQNVERGLSSRCGAGNASLVTSTFRSLRRPPPFFPTRRVEKNRQRSQFFHQRQPPSKLQSSQINLREWISRLWVFYGKPVRVKLWFRLNEWMKRLYLKNLAVPGTAGGHFGCCC
jgi:hypothetical protein